jgi:hypothetical protein
VLGECTVVIKAPPSRNDVDASGTVVQDISEYEVHCMRFLASAASALSVSRPPAILGRTVTSVTFQFQCSKTSLNLPFLALHVHRVPGWTATIVSKVALLVNSANPWLASYDATIFSTGTIMVTTGAGLVGVRRIYQEISSFLEHYIQLNTPPPPPPQ